MSIREKQEALIIKRNEERISEAINTAKNFTFKTLSKTDWYIVRNADSGVAIPDEIKESRAALREKLSAFETALNAIDANDVKVEVNNPIVKATADFYDIKFE